MKIFLSAVSAQFRECRQALASDLRAVGCEVKVQEDFQQHGGTLLEKLQAYIHGCDRVIALIGNAYGWEPDQKGLSQGMPRRSYTQWEYFLAAGERLNGMRQTAKDVYVYLASADYLTDHPIPQEADQEKLQADFLDALKASGKDRNQFGSLHELCHLVLRDGFKVQERPEEKRAKPNNLPFPTLGPLFKGRDKALTDLETEFAKHPFQVIWGLGGSGKTRLAVEYAWHFQSKYQALLYVCADSKENLLNGLSNLADAPLRLLKDKTHQAVPNVAVSNAPDRGCTEDREVAQGTGLQNGSTEKEIDQSAGTKRDTDKHDQKIAPETKEDGDGPPPDSEIRRS